MDEIFGGIVVTVVFVFALFGVTHIAGDFRNFDSITKECAEQGYIQNHTTRIVCHKEVRT